MGQDMTGETLVNVVFVVTSHYLNQCLIIIDFNP